MIKSNSNKINRDFFEFLYKYGLTQPSKEEVRYMNNAELRVYKSLEFQTEKPYLGSGDEDLKRYLKAPTKLSSDSGVIPIKEYDTVLETLIIESYSDFYFDETDKSNSFIILDRNGTKIPFQDIMNEVSQITFTKSNQLRVKLRYFSTKNS